MHISTRSRSLAKAMNNELQLAPGMGLTSDELVILKGHAEGKRNKEICNELNLTPPELSLAEQDIRYKLNAKTTPHMISRAFQLGLLRVMCLVLCFCSVMDLDDQTVRSRTRTQQSRTVRAGRREMGTY
uniref:HTH luxR-type domain-containing protein n=1 Tax=Aliivibrio phage vB_Alvi_H905 TaxID=3234039 RepID=A0AB39C9U8_9VIRU